MRRLRNGYAVTLTMSANSPNLRPIDHFLLCFRLLRPIRALTRCTGPSRHDYCAEYSARAHFRGGDPAERDCVRGQSARPIYPANREARSDESGAGEKTRPPTDTVFFYPQSGDRVARIRHPVWKFDCCLLPPGRTHLSVGCQLSSRTGARAGRARGFLRGREPRYRDVTRATRVLALI